jgi:hypothetical protein
LRKVAPVANDLHERFRVNYYIQGLNPMIAGRTFESSPDTLTAAIDKAKSIEAGNNLTFQRFDINSLNMNESLTNKP